MCGNSINIQFININSFQPYDVDTTRSWDKTGLILNQGWATASLLSKFFPTWDSDSLSIIVAASLDYCDDEVK